MCEFYEVQIMEMHHCTPIRSVSNLGKGNVLSFCKGATQGNKTQPSSSQNFQNKDHKLHFLGAVLHTKKNHFKLLQILLAVLVANKVGPV